MPPYSIFVVTAPGLEPLVERELLEMGVRGVAEPGGVAWEGDLEQLYDANLRLRAASRVVVRVAEFGARAFYEMERHVTRVPWERFVAPGSVVRLRVASTRSRLYHERAIEERVLRAIDGRVGGIAAAPAGDPAGDPEAEAEAPAPAGQMFVVRFHRDRCTISADTSGELLHRRGYRLAVAKAPLRETLACAMLRAAGWDCAAPLLDPFCGAGTIPIEAALAARRIAPGLARADRAPREYRFQAWGEHDAGVWSRVVDRAAGEILDAAPGRILGSDRDAGAVEAARANADRAGVGGDIELGQAALSAITPPAGPGWLVTNPPYGLRVGERKRLRNLYASFGRIARERLEGWTVAMLGADPVLEAQTGIRFRDALRTRNGGIPVRVIVGRGGQGTAP
jgi:putative N6-adenine-specific DNA methylase